MNIKAVTQQVEMLVFKTRLDTNLDVLGTQFQNEWIDEESLKDTLDYLSIEPSDFISYIQKAEWFDDNQKILDLIESIM